MTRPGLLWETLRFYDQGDPHGQLSLFEQNASAKPTLRRFSPSSSPYTERLKRKHEVETLGFLLSIHPLDRYEKTLRGIDYVQAKDLSMLVGKRVTTIGWLVTGKTVRTRDGAAMKFVTFEDRTGLYETVFFPEVYNQYCHLLSALRPYVLKGKVEKDFGAINITVDRVGFLDR
jgi:error-prone DNA polymerase